jgi:Tfp pilus assembly protein PilN
MIDINLLPVELRPRPRSPLPYLMTVVLAIAVVSYCLIAFVDKWQTISDFEKRITELDEQIAEVHESAEAVKELEAGNRLLNAKQAAISTIMPDRIVWSKVIVMLAELVPEDVWLSDLAVSSKSVPIQVPNPDSQAAQKTVTQYVPRRKLEITGYALSLREEEGVNHVGRFVSAMENEQDPNYNPEFAALFSNPDPQSVDDKVFEDTPVKEFKIWCDIVKKGAKQ